ncbi:UNKNOWN [Stylonychia lemnae]|uniref:Uncharacterized protein n=1 Tax=Stylonychia lemnae TaxID=5949 RepID=A0A077ZTF2_STYLE|nr:UNKNOWN [Stylonychia lemnae]|eukprot:CDW72799.1 UNKNOWN [Stylonychia lemnae]
MAGNRFKYVDYLYVRHLGSDSATAKAADEIISQPDKHLLTQQEIFQAEGGLAGLAIQASSVTVGLVGLFALRPRLLSYLKNGQLRPLEWLTLGSTAFVSYHIGHQIGSVVAGDAQRLQNHWMAYYFVKQNNRFEGRQILSKKPGMY